MAFFGKLKNLHNGPPAPPRRTDNSADSGWPPDEFDDEDGDMYEVPPCEPDVKIQKRQMEENLYLDRSSNVAPPSRLCDFPKPQPRNNFSFEHNTKKPPEIDRNEKPGRKKVPSTLVPEPMEEDVYLDPNVDEEPSHCVYPNEEEDSMDDVYLEPTEACSPPPTGPKKMPPVPKMKPAPKPPMLKPPVPRAKSNSLLFIPPNVAEAKTVPSVEERRAIFPIKVPSLFNLKPALAAVQRDLGLSGPNPPPADAKPVAFPNSTRMTKQSGNEDKEWFAGDCSRNTATDLLEKVNKDGAFLIRHSSAQNPRQPYTLAVLYQQKVYNIPIRFLEDTQGYALGKEGKKSEEIFVSLDEMISYHKNNQLLLIDSKSQAKHTAHLIHPVRP